MARGQSPWQFASLAAAVLRKDSNLKLYNGLSMLPRKPLQQRPLQEKLLRLATSTSRAKWNDPFSKPVGVF